MRRHGSQVMCRRNTLIIKIYLSLRHSSTVSNQFGGGGEGGGKYQRTSKGVSFPDSALFQGSVIWEGCVLNNL